MASSSTVVTAIESTQQQEIEGMKEVPSDEVALLNAQVATAKINSGKSMMLAGLGSLVDSVRSMAEEDKQKFGGVLDPELVVQLNKIESAFDRVQQVPDIQVQGPEEETKKAGQGSTVTTATIVAIAKDATPDTRPVYNFSESDTADTVGQEISQSKRKYTFILYGSDNAASREAFNAFMASARNLAGKPHAKFYFVNTDKHKNANELVKFDNPTHFPSVFLHTRTSGGKTSKESSHETVSHIKTFLKNRSAVVNRS